MKTALPTDTTKQASTDELLAKIALLEQQQKQQQEAYRQRLTEERQQYEQKIRQYQAQIDHLIEKQKLLIHHLFGQKNEGLTPKQDHLGKESALEDLSALEQIKDNTQNELDDNPSSSANADETLISQNELATENQHTNDDKQTKPKRGWRIVIPDDLEVRTLIHKPTSLTCECGCPMKRIGEDIQDKLGFIPAKFYRERHIYPKYVCKGCQDQTLVQVSVSAQLIDKSIATPELLTHIIMSKFADH